MAAKKTQGNSNGAHAHRPAHHAHPHAHLRSDDGTAFLPDPYGSAHAPARSSDELAEELAEEFLTSATAAEEVGAEARDAIVPEETGGPFIETTGAQEFAPGVDASNPLSAEREAFPTATRAPRGG